MRARASIAAINALVLAAALLIACRFAGVACARICAFAGIPMMLAVSLSEFSLCDKEKRSKERDSVLFALQQIYSAVNHNGKSLLAAMGDALSAMDRDACADAYDVLHEIRKRMLLGEQLDDAASCACAGAGPACTAWRGIAREY